MDIEEIDQLLVDSEEFWNIDVTDELVEAIRLAYTDGLRDAANYLGNLTGVQLGLSFDVVDPRVLEFIEDRAVEMVKNINRGTQHFLRSMIYGGVQEGVREDDLVAAILENLFQSSDFSEKRIRSICRFEIARAQSDGWIKQMESVGLEHKLWSTIGGDACPICRANEAMGPQPVHSKPYDTVFGEKCAGPPAHPNYCRCHLDAVASEVDQLGKEIEFYTGKSEAVEKGGLRSGSQRPQEG